MESTFLSRLERLEKKSNLSTQDKKRSALSMIDVLVSSFFQALCSDVFPQEEIELIFGIKTSEIFSDSFSSMPIGHLVYWAWKTLLLNKIINKKRIKRALIEGNLPEVFQNESASLSKATNSPSDNYFTQLIQKGFNNIIWDKKVHQKLMELANEIKREQSSTSKNTINTSGNEPVLNSKYTTKKIQHNEKSNNTSGKWAYFEQQGHD